MRRNVLWTFTLAGTVEFHDRVARRWREERQRCIHDLESLDHAEDDLIDDGIALLDIARNAYEDFPDRPSSKGPEFGAIERLVCKWRAHRWFPPPFDFSCKIVWW